MGAEVLDALALRSGILVFADISSRLSPMTSHKLSWNQELLGAIQDEISCILGRSASGSILISPKSMKAVAQGNLDQTVQVAQVAELSELANSFNQMALQLQTLFSRLSSLNQDLADRESQLQQYLEALPIGVLIHDKSSRLIYVNQVGKRLLSMQQVMQVTADRLAETYQIYHADTQELYPTEQMPIALALQGETMQVDNLEVWGERHITSLEVKATPIFNENGQISYAIAILQDITARKSAEQQLIHNARHDLLTGLPNRTLLMEQLEFNLTYAKRVSRYQLALLFIDLDRFKVINDSLGHLVGDELLIQIAHVLQNLASPPDLAARLGGDEYILLLNDVDGIQDAISVAQQVLTELSEPFSLRNRSVFISASIGIVLGSSHYSQASDLLRDADIAMYRAKVNGKSRYEIFNVEMYTTVLDRLQVENELRDAIAQEAFRMMYQPIVVLKTGELVGFEALVRWQHPSRGIVPPDKFIPLAEEMGLINDLTIWVLQEACRQLADWRDRIPTLPPLKMSVNLSVKDLDEHLVTLVAKTLTETGIPATCLTLEVTEGTLIHDIEDAIAFLTATKQLGVTISIDDFGTGYSSLNYLCRLPLDNLKIDRSFINSMQEDERNRRIVETIIALSNELGLNAIAEGVETTDQQLYLSELECELAQGYLFSRPQDAATLLTSLTQERFQYPTES